MRYFLMFAVTKAALAADPPEQAKRGQGLFNLKSSPGYACATCHQVAGQGKAVGPDLLATRTQYVKAIAPLNRKPYPVIQSGEIFYDLSKNPPLLVNLTPEEPPKARDNADWKHPPESRGLTKPQLADLIAYLRFVAIGDTKGVDPQDLNRWVRAKRVRPASPRRKAQAASAPL